jgi:hypothetical protein
LKIPLIVERDPRFPTKRMGTITVITVANGYNEHVEFNVSVNEFDNKTGMAFIVLEPLKSGQRNESTFNVAFHRFTVFETLDYYAKKIGLTKQKVPADIMATPWGPNLSR